MSKATAPYNFVELPETVYTPEQVLPPFDRYYSSLYSGQLDLTITTETDTYVRCAPPEKKLKNEPINQKAAELQRNQVHRQDFYHQGDPDHPVIPGSSIRGMLRAVLSVISYARMREPSDKRMLYREVFGKGELVKLYRQKMTPPQQQNRRHLAYPGDAVRAGYLEVNGADWFIQPAKLDVYGNSFVLADAREVKGQCNVSQGEDPKKYPKGVVGVFVKPVKKGQKQGHVTLDVAYPAPISKEPADGYEPGVLVIPGKPPNIRNRHMFPVFYEQDDKAKRLKVPPDVKALYQDDITLPRASHMKPRELKETGQPLFYRLENGEVEFIGATMLFRIPHTYTPKDLLPAAHKLDKKSKFDLVDLLFGTVRKSGATIKSRVAVEDALWNGEGEPFYPSGGRKSPRILSSPKPTAFQHYIKDGHWSQENAKLRGYKRYWHRRGVTPYEGEPKTKSSQHTVIRPVKAGTVFTGRVLFENLSLLELGALLSATWLPDKLRHKLGMGKPYGMGSVKVDASLVIESRERRYSSELFAADGSFTNSTLPSDETERVLTKAEAAFVEAISGHLGKTDDITNVWNLDAEEINDLYDLLNFENAPDAKETQYMKVNAEQWRDRKTLPYPDEISS